MTVRASGALHEIRKSNYEISAELGRLEEEDLLAFIEKAREDGHDPSDPAGSEIWKGIIRSAEKRLEIDRIWKSEDGTWYAAVEKLTHETLPSSGGKIATVDYRKCASRAAAIEAAREMLVRHASLFDEVTEIEARIYRRG